MELEFPAWLRLTHLFNIVFVSLLVRSGLEILSAHPKLYWNDHCRHGSDWLRFTRRRMPSDRLWTSKDEEESFPSWLALPGGGRLGLGRHWHFVCVLAWIATGLAYILLLIVSGEWRWLIPESWRAIPRSWEVIVDYLNLRAPPTVPGEPYNALQQVIYGLMVFVVAPLQIATGAAMSPAIANRFARYVRLFGGRQAARSLHFLTLAVFGLFTLVHTALVIIEAKLPTMVQGRASTGLPTAYLVAGLVLAGLLGVHVLLTRLSTARPRLVQRTLGALLNPLRRLLFGRLRAVRFYDREDVSPQPRVNGRPPNDERYRAPARAGFAAWQLEVCGLVEQPLTLTLAELLRLPRQDQVTLHHCIQGWPYVAEWSGVPLRDVLDRCRPLPQARYVVFHAPDDNTRSEPDPEGDGFFYGTLSLELARHPHTILADHLNGSRLPIEHGAPLRLRVETQLSFKMVKYLRTIELVADYRTISAGQGGWREDHQYYDTTAGI